jgi:ectoine hydrolase
VPHFERSEFLARVEQTSQQLEAAGLDGLLIADPANMYYLSGYEGASYFLPQFLVVKVGEAEPYWIGRLQDAAGAKVSAFMNPAHIVGYPEYYVGSKERHPTEFIAQWLQEQGWGKAHIGVEMDSMCFTPRAFENLKTGLPGATFKDAEGLVNRVRKIKSPQELIYLRQAAVISDLTIEVGFAHYDVGVRECDVTATFYRQLIGGRSNLVLRYLLELTALSVTAEVSANV